jgi:glycosyltransferase involved in cell wall biosynthesis
MKYPEISVIISNYNHEKWIERCIRSLASQKNLQHFDFEIIVTDDCSTDNSLKILKKCEQTYDNLILSINKKNIGLQKSINNAIRESKGRYIVRVDSDDYVSDYFLFMMSFFLKKNRNYHAVCVDYNLISANEKIIKRKSPHKEEISCAIMYRKEILIDLGLYNEEFQMREGHELKKRFLKKYIMGYLELPLYNYRMHDNNRTKNKTELNKFDNKLEKKI